MATFEREARVKASVPRLKEIVREWMHETSDPDEIRSHAKAIEEATELRPRRFTAPNTGTQERTEARVRFLEELAGRLGISDRRKIAKRAVQESPDAVRELWNSGGNDAVQKIQGFLKRNRLLGRSKR
jgi:GAF domain-containing protein